MITGLTRGSTRGHIARAALEGIAFQNADLLEAMQKDLGHPLTQLNVDGGASVNDLLMQFQSDVLGVKLKRPKHRETTSLGAVFAAGLGVGIWSDLKQIQKTWQEDREFMPNYNSQQRDEALKCWHKAVERVRLKP
jgi:glycerol kinase